jgi:iron complex transport system substrate-binding protein
MPRVVSLLASATEIVCALGRQADLVGRSHECDFPHSIQALPICTRPRFPVEGTSAEIDAHVKALLAAREPIYEVDSNLMIELRPDVILTQSQCVVCAVSDEDVARALIPGLEPKPRVVSLAPNNLHDLWSSIMQVAEAIGADQRGRTLIDELRHRMAAIADDALALPTRPTVACLEWLDPLMAAGNWAPELVEMAGGLNVFGVAGKHSPWLSWDELLHNNPDTIIAMPCGFDLARTLQETKSLARDARFCALRAAKKGDVFAVDGNQFFNRPGPRLVESLEILAEIIHPERFHFGHEGLAWRRIHP